MKHFSNQIETAEASRALADRRSLWIVRIAAAIGLCISAYLLYVTMSGQAALGCGEGEAGCHKILGTRWSKVFGFPVSGSAVAIYLVILVVSRHAGAGRPSSEQRGAWRVLLIAGVAAGGAALWFIGLQLVELRSICLYCMAAHACSLVIATATLLHGPRLAALPGLLLPAALIAIQIFLPPTITGDEARRITGLSTEDWPTLGNPEAPHVVGLLFDYNCGHCLVAHDLLADAAERSDGQLAVVLLPTAIDPRINPHVSSPTYISQTTPELARLMLAVWSADPGKAAAFDAYLVEQIPKRREEGVVPLQTINTQFRSYAAELVGEDALAAAEQDPRIDVAFDRTATIYKLTPNPATGHPGVPRAIIGGVPYPGFETAEQLEQALQQAYPDLTLTDR